MSLSSKVTLSFMAGAIFAVFAWLLIDFTGIYKQGGGGTQTQVFTSQAIVGAIFGILVGLGIGLVNGLSTGSTRRLLLELAWGGTLGLAGGLTGLYFGQMFYGPLHKDPELSALNPWKGPLIYLQNVVVRAIGWALIGMFLGMAQGVPSRSAKTARHGAIGGFIGGLMGGSLFEIFTYFPFSGSLGPGVLSRGISMTVTGAAIGLFIGLAENLLKQAWVRVVQGRNEGREYIISKARTTIGRDELSDIGLFGDRNVAPMHAVIESISGGRHVLRDSGSFAGTSINGHKITEHTLRDGEIIEIGAMRLEFREKATASKVPKLSDVAPKPPVQIPTMAGQCPFCGGRKDPTTGDCACSVGGQPAAPPPTMSWQIPGAGPASVPQGGVPRLVGLSGPYAGQIFPLSPTGSVSIGREDGRNVTLSLDTTVSRRHAYISNENGSFVVYDEGSSNGTAVNGMRITRQPLMTGDTVEFGSSAFRFEE